MHIIIHIIIYIIIHIIIHIIVHFFGTPISPHFFTCTTWCLTSRSRTISVHVPAQFDRDRYMARMLQNLQYLSLSFHIV